MTSNDQSRKEAGPIWTSNGQRHLDQEFKNEGSFALAMFLPIRPSREWLRLSEAAIATTKDSLAQALWSLIPLKDAIRSAP